MPKTPLEVTVSLNSKQVEEIREMVLRLVGSLQPALDELCSCIEPLANTLEPGHIRTVGDLARSIRERHGA